jgi:hypothetical protein
MDRKTTFVFVTSGQYDMRPSAGERQGSFESESTGRSGNDRELAYLRRDIACCPNLH